MWQQLLHHNLSLKVSDSYQTARLLVNLRDCQKFPLRRHLHRRYLNTENIPATWENISKLSTPLKNTKPKTPETSVHARTATADLASSSFHKLDNTSSDTHLRPSLSWTLQVRLVAAAAMRSCCLDWWQKKAPEYWSQSCCATISWGATQARALADHETADSWSQAAPRNTHQVQRRSNRSYCTLHPSSRPPYSLLFSPY